MSGRIRTSLDKIDTVVPRFHTQFKSKITGEWITVKPSERGAIGCLCLQCKISGLKYHMDTIEGIKVPSRDNHAPKGRTYRQQIEESLKGEDYTVEEEGGFITYTW